MFDTIAAISTPLGEGGIGIIRITGPESFKILDSLFVSKSEKKSGDFRNFSLNYGDIIDGNGNIIDESLVGIMRGPKSYTKEDMVEINCHGGYLVTEKILEEVLKKGARMAEPGEFTKIAFMNGRIDLTKAEAVIDLIRSKTEKSISISLNHLRGDLQKKIAELKLMLLDVSAHVNVIIDYPEEGIEEPLPDELKDSIINVKDNIRNLIKTYEKGRKIKEGVKTAILGKPNVGKSSLLNALLREERAIVTHIPGTTRDIIEEVINIKGLPLILVDTAGIRKTDDFVENIGVKKSIDIIDKTDLILFMIDGSMEIENEDIEIYEKIKEKKVIGIINKIDMGIRADISRFSEIEKWINISAKETMGIEEMEDDIYGYMVSSEDELLSNALIITNVRHKAALEKTYDSVCSILNTIDTGMPMDLIAVDLKEAIDNLSEITGEITNEHILDHIFKNFCVGK